MDPRQDVVVFEIDAHDEQHECLEIHTKYDVSQPVHEIEEVCKCFVILSEASEKKHRRVNFYEPRESRESSILWPRQGVHQKSDGNRVVKHDQLSH